MLTVNECVCLLFTVSEWYAGMINLLTNNVATTKAIEPIWSHIQSVFLSICLLSSFLSNLHSDQSDGVMLYRTFIACIYS